MSRRHRSRNRRRYGAHRTGGSRRISNYTVSRGGIRL